MPRPLLRTAGIAAAAFAACLAVFTTVAFMNSRRPVAPVDLSGFRSDFSSTSGKGQRPLYADDLGRSARFLAFSRYTRLPAGTYRATFEFAPDGGAGTVDVEVAAERGRRILARRRLSGDAPPVLDFQLARTVEVEPRVRVVNGGSHAPLLRVRIRCLARQFPWPRILACTLLFGWLAAFLLLGLDSGWRGQPSWRIWLALFLVSAGLALVVSRAWISEDAFITLRHVDNLLHGYGPVYNPGERVEGYTHVLWLGLAAIFRWAGMPPKGAVMLPSLLLTLVTLLIILLPPRGVIRRDGSGRWWVNPALPLLLGTSGFIDFSTSGLETPLSFCLLALYALLLRRERIPALGTGIVLALLVLTRPDFIVFAVVASLFLLPSRAWRNQRVRRTIRLWLPGVMLLGIVQIWRMGYYAAWLPNPFYAKSGAGAHWSQGMAYLGDLILGSPLSIIFILALAGTLLAHRLGTKDRRGRLLVVMSAMVHAFFVVRGGGDFMHARFLLPALFLLSLAADLPLPHWSGGRKRYRAPAAVVLATLMMVLALQIRPVQTRGRGLYHHGISDERYSYYGNRRMPLSAIFHHRLLFIWRTMGQNYAHLTERIRRPVTVAYANIGFLGFYAGPRVRVIDRLGLTDPVTARVALKRRRRPGHEKTAPLAYLIHRRVTFAASPFPLWNRLADTPFGVLWDLSPGLLRRLQGILPRDFKNRLDRGVQDYLETMAAPTAHDAEWLFFLSRQWLPHAPEGGRRLFRRRVDPDWLSVASPSARWLAGQEAVMDELLARLHGPLSPRRFVGNLKSCLAHPLGIRFPAPESN